MLWPGVDVNAPGCPISRRRIRSRLGIIPQDSWLFSGSLRSNLNVDGAYTDEQIIEALSLVQLDRMLNSLEGGLDAEVSEKGSNFSAGQVQLVCLARVLLKRPSMVFMDEATASVDLRTDAFVQETIRTQLHDCSILTIAHRLLTVIDYDRIVVMDAGCVAEFGTPHSLLQQQTGLFSALVSATGAASEAELRERAAAAASGGVPSVEERV